MQYAPKARPWHLEKFTFKDHGDSSYTHPPMDAVAIQSVFESFMGQDRQQEAYSFLARNYSKATKRFDYFAHIRQNSPDDRLIWNIHPHETGRDSDVTFDFFKKKLPRRGINTPLCVDAINSVLDYAHDMRLNVRLAKVGWEPEQARRLFGVNDVMFNVIYADNLGIMSELALSLAGGEDNLGEKTIYLEQAVAYRKWADEVTEAISTKMWFANARGGKGAFYALKPDGSPIEAISPSNFSPLILPGIKPEQRTACINTMLEYFNTRFPFASASTREPGYDPHFHQRGRLWQGMKMMIADEYLVTRGLRAIAEADPYSLEGFLCAVSADIVAQASLEVVEPGYAEGYDPENGKRLRNRKVRNFSWSTLADTMPHYGLADRLIQDDDYFNLCRRIGRILPITQLDEASSA